MKLRDKARAQQTAGRPQTGNGQYLRRRRYLAGSGAVATTVLAGCSTVFNFIADLVIDDVNVVNAGAETRAGTIEVVDPDGETVLSSEFEVDPGEDDETYTESDATFGDVFTGSGEYTVTIELADGDEIDGETSVERTGTVADPDEEHLVVLLDVPDGVVLEVIEEFTDLEAADG